MSQVVVSMSTFGWSVIIVIKTAITGNTMRNTFLSVMSVMLPYSIVCMSSLKKKMNTTTTLVIIILMIETPTRSLMFCEMAVRFDRLQVLRYGKNKRREEKKEQQAIS